MTDYFFFCGTVVKIPNLKAPLCIMHKNLPTFWANRKAARKCTKICRIYGYIVPVLFLTIGKPNICQHKSLGKSATDFYPNIQKPEKGTIEYWNWLPTFLRLISGLPNIWWQYIFCLNNDRKKYCIHISYTILDVFAGGYLICTGKLFALTAWNLFNSIS
jgi:hypothetical protein